MVQADDNQSEQPLPPLPEIVRRLGHRRAVVRRAAQAELERAAAMHPNEVLRAAGEETLHWRASRVYWLLGTLLPAYVLMYLALPPFLHAFADWWRTALVVALCVPVMLLWMMFMDRWCQRSIKVRPYARAIANSDDLRAVRPLIAAHVLPDKGDRSAVEAALIRLLPRLQTSNAGLLNDEDRTWLRAIVRPGSSLRASPELVGATLNALERVGGKQELGVVRRCAAKHPDHEVRAAARVCAAALEARLGTVRPEEVLLRAAEAAPERARLVRPAASAQDDERQLVRPSGRGEEDGED